MFLIVNIALNWSQFVTSNIFEGILYPSRYWNQRKTLIIIFLNIGLRLLNLSVFSNVQSILTLLSSKTRDSI